MIFARSHLTTFAATLCGTALMTLSVSAAVMTFDGRTDYTSGNPQINLTDIGDLDWAYWDTSDDPASGAATNSKNGGASIGLITGTGTTSAGPSTAVRGTANVSTTVDYIFTDGASTVSGTATNVSGLFNKVIKNSSDNGVANQGVDLTFILPEAGQAYEVSIWAAGFGTRHGVVTGELSGVANFNSGNTDGIGANSHFADSTSPKKEEYMYKFTVTPDADNDMFTFGISTSTSVSTNGHVLISGAAISVVPEPSSLVVLGVTLAALGMRPRGRLARS